MIAVAAALTGCQPDNDAEDLSASPLDSSQRSLLVNVMRASWQDGTTDTSIHYGRLRPQQESQLAFMRSGRVESVSARVGQRAAEGELLAALAASDLNAQETALQQSLDDQSRELANTRDAAAGALQQQIAQTRTELAQLQVELDQGIISAPYDCIVADIQIAPGELASPQSPALSVVLDRTPVVDVNLPSRIAAESSAGRGFEIRVGKMWLEGTLQSLSPIQDAAGSRTARLTVSSELIDQTEWSFGQIVEVRLTIETDQSGYWLPLSALQREANDLWSVSILATESGADGERQTVDRRPVEIVRLEDQLVLVQGELAGEALVVVDGTHRIVPGQLVEPVDVTDQIRLPTAPGATP